MKKILVNFARPLATTTMVAAFLVACNADTGSDITSDNASPVFKAVCTSSNNWQSVGIGMSSSEVEARLGKAATITSTTTITTYTYERCRAGVFVSTAATDTTEAQLTAIYFGGTVVFTNGRGVASVTSPTLDSELPMNCELDLYNYPSNYNGAGGSFVCRSVNNPY